MNAVRSEKTPTKLLQHRASASSGRPLGWDRRQGHRLAEHFDTRFGLVRMLTQVRPLLPPTILPLIEPQHVAGYVM